MFYLVDPYDMYLEDYDENGCSYTAFQSNALTFRTEKDARRTAAILNKLYGWRKLQVLYP